MKSFLPFQWYGSGIRTSHNGEFTTGHYITTRLWIPGTFLLNMLLEKHVNPTSVRKHLTATSKKCDYTFWA